MIPMKPFLPALFLFLLAPAAQAASIEIAPSMGEAGPGEEFTLVVSIGADDAPVNAAEGFISVPEGVRIRSASTAGSVFSLWPASPAYERAIGGIAYSGGVPGGILAGTSGTLLTIRASADEPGNYVFSPRGTTVYQNDGLGTPDSVTTAGAVIAVREGASAARTDKAEPAPLVASIGSDPSLFDGKYFVAYYGGDRGAGVLRYEVKEGVFGSYKPAGRYYVLEDQTLGRQVTVRSVDADGVAASTVLPAKHGIPGWVFVAGAVFAALALWRLIRRMRTRL